MYAQFVIKTLKGKEFWFADKKFYIVNKVEWLKFLSDYYPELNHKYMNHPVAIDTAHRTGFWYIRTENVEIHFFKKVLSIKEVNMHSQPREYRFYVISILKYESMKTVCGFHKLATTNPNPNPQKIVKI